MADQEATARGDSPASVGVNPGPTNRGRTPRCFIAMPMSVPEVYRSQYDDREHWKHVLEYLFVPAIEAAGYTPIRPASDGTRVIHDWIFEQLSSVELVLGDFSSQNANVFYELGIRTALNLPMTLVLDEKTTPPFDLGALNSYTYDSGLRPWNIAAQIDRLARHIRTSAETCAGENPLWYRFSLGRTARVRNDQVDPGEARLRLLEDRFRAFDILLRNVGVDLEGSDFASLFTKGGLQVDLADFHLADLQVSVDENTFVQDLLNEVYYGISDYVSPYAYLREWQLTTSDGRVLASRGTDDRRPLLATWGLSPNETLKARPLPLPPAESAGPSP